MAPHSPGRYRRFTPWLLVLCVLLIGSCGDKEKPQAGGTTHRIGVLQLGTHPVIDEVVTSLEARLRELYGAQASVGKYNANFDMSALSMLANQAIGDSPSVVVGVTTPASAMLIGSNRGTTPLVFTFVSDPKDVGYSGAGSLPNVTGLSDQVEYRKTLALVRTLVPAGRRVGYLLTKGEANAVTVHKEFSRLAAEFNLELHTAYVANPTEVRQAADLLAGSVDLFLFGGDNTVMAAINVLIDTAKAQNKPVISCDERSVALGAVAAYSVSYSDMGRRTADYCALIIGGAKPSSIPVEIFRASRLILNTKAAEELGVAVSQFVRDTADVVLR